MQPTREFLQKTIESCKAEMEKQRINFERQDAVVKFCEYMLERGIYVEGEKEAPDGLEHKETAGE